VTRFSDEPTDPNRDDYQDDAKVKLLLQRAIDDAAMNTARQERDRQDLYNLLFYRGGEDCQWIVWNGSSWQPRPYDGPDGVPAWVPRPATNKYAKKLDGAVAILNQSSPAKTFVPMTDDDDDRATAEIAEDADPVLLEEIGYTRLRGRINQLVAMTDKVAVVYYYEEDPKYGTAEIPLMQCLDCHEFMTPMETEGSPVDEMDAAGEDAEPVRKCMHCGSENVTVAIDPRNGKTLGYQQMKGKICAELWSSYEFSLPSTAKVADADLVPWVLGHVQMPIEEACRHWPKFAAQIRATGPAKMQGAAAAGQYAAAVRGLSSPRAAQSGHFGGSQDAQKGMVTVYRLQHDAIEDDEVDFPDGLLAVQIGEHIVDKGPLPRVDASGCHKKNILIRQWADVPLTPFGKPVADDLSVLQKARNRNESMIEMIDMHNAAPTVWLPDDVTLVDELTGTPGSVHRYRSLHPGSKPFTERGVTAPEGLYRRLEMIDADMDEISGLNAVLQGERISADATYGETKTLEERGMSMFRTPLDHLIDFEKRQSIMLLDIARQTGWFPRFRKIRGDDGQWEVRQFAAADLRGAVDISIDPMSAWPKTPSMQMMKLGKAMETGAVMPQGDPEVATKILTILDLTEIKPSLNADRKQVARELDRWKAAAMPQQIAPPNLAIIDIPIHLFLKRQFLKSEQAETLAEKNPAVFQAMVQHVEMLQYALNPPAPAPPSGPDGSAVEGAVSAGAMVPAGAIPQGPPPLEQAVGAGALMPAAAAAANQPQGPSIDELMAQEILSPAPQPAAQQGNPTP
jgi:hypothetical protein